jgi:beta-lactamase class D
MQRWIDSIGYGDRDISCGIDNFWLSVEDKKSIKISPDEQALMIRKLVTGKLPFSEKAKNILKEVMIVKKTTNGTLYGKTGSGSKIDGDPKQNIGWYVGYIESNNKTYSFACLLKAEKVTGKDAHDLIETILAKVNML